jgi:hypothetical protein
MSVDIALCYLVPGFHREIRRSLEELGLADRFERPVNVSKLVVDILRT